jgi:hypothetical protein
MSRRRILSLAVTIPFAMILVALSAASPAARLAPGEMEGVGEQEAETAVIVTGAVDPRTPRLSSPAIGADGRVVAYLEHPDGTGLADLKVTSWDGTAWSLPTTLLSLPAGRAGRPVMSAEGATVAIAEERGAGRYAIWIVDRQGEVWAPAEELRARVSGPALSLDRTGRLLALTEEVSGQPQVVVRRREGLVWSERELVSDPRQGPAQHPSLTPGGTALAFVQRDRVMTARADDEGWIVSEWRETAEAGSQLAWPILAADGSTAFFWRLALRDGKPVKQLFAASRDGSASAPRRIGAPSASGEPGDGPAAVDAAGTTVVRAHDGSLAIARFEAGRWVSTSLPASLGVVGSPVMTADGTRVVWAGRDPQTPTASAVLAASSSKKPAISLPAPRLDFGSTNLDTAVTRSFSIRNTGRAKLKVSRLAFDGGSGGPFVLGKVKLPATIKPGKSLSVPATFTPRELGEWTALVWISSNDPVSPVVGQVLAGTGFWPAPELTAISPSEGPEGTSATLTGSGFGTDASRVTVTVWGGYHYDAAIRSVSGSSIAVTMPTGYCAWRGYQDANVWVTVRGMQSNGRYFRLTNLLPCEPSIVMMEPDAGSVGDVITLQAYGLPAELDRILVSFNGTIVHPDSIRPDWDPELAYITVRVPVGATSGPVRLKRTDGVDRWSQPAEFTVVEPVILGLTAGAEAAGIVVPVVYYDIGLPSESAREVGPAPWRLGGAGFSRIRASLDHPAGTLNLEVTTPNGVATTELTAIGDDAGIVNRPPWVLFKGMKPGAAFTVRAWGYELPGGTIRSSAPLPLTVGRVLYPGTATAINSAFEFPVREGKLAMAQGDTLVVSGIFRDESVSAPGLWDGAVTLNAYGHPFALQAGQLYSKVVQLDQPGSFTIANQTTGQSIQVEVLAAGNNSEYYFDNNRGFAFGEALAREGVTLGCGGARLTIPPGALPPYATGPEQTSEYYDVSCAHVPETRPFADDTLGDAGHSLAISIQPEPPELLQPITIEMPYTMEGRFSRPEMGVYDPATQLYFKLTAAEDDGAGRIRLTLPARKYPMDGGSSPSPSSRTLAVYPPDSVPNAPLNQIVQRTGLYAARTTNPILRDETRKLIVDYISDPSSSSNVSDAYAQETFATAQQTYDLLVAQGWPRPDGWFGGWITLSIRKPWIWTSQHGSTTSGVFGQPWITINPVKTSQGANLKTTVAHEMGHAFQRQLTTNLSTKWFDEASANAIAWMLLGNQADLTTDLSSFPLLPNSSIPSGFYRGYSTDEAYAAGSFAIWMEKNYPQSILKTYQRLSWDPRYWYDSYGTFAEATGAPNEMATLVHGWGKWYWSQQEYPVSGLDLSHLRPEIADWSGVTIQQARPAASSDRADVAASVAFAPQLRGKDVVASFRTNGTGQDAVIYGDNHICTSPPGTLTELAVMNHLTQPVKKLGTYGTYACYRVIVSNYDLSDAAEIEIRIYSPHVATISPSSGSRNGGYPLTVNGTGFGAGGANTRVTVGGWNCPVTAWSDTRVTCTMPALPSTGPYAVQVQTQEFVKTNTVTFTAN